MAQVIRSISHVFLVLAVFVGPVIFTGCETLPDTPTTVLMRDGDHEFEWGRYESAAERYLRILEREPGDPRALEMYGRCMLALDQPKQAVDAFTGAVARRPGDRELLVLLATASFESGDVDEAFDLLRTWALDNTDAKAWIVLAEFAGRAEDPDTARDAVIRSIEIDPTGGPEAYLVSADLERGLGENGEALRRLRQAYGLAPGDPAIEDRLRAFGEVPGPTLILPPGP